MVDESYNGQWFDDDSEDFSEYDDDKSIRLRDWQRRAKQYFFKKRNCVFEVATGTGKTLIAVDIINDILDSYPDKKVLIIVPKNVILETGWYKELTDYGIPIQDIGVYYGNIKEFSKITITNMQNAHKIPYEIFDVLVADECHNYGTLRMLNYLNKPFEYKLGLTATLSNQDKKHLKVLEAFDYNKFVYNPEDALDDGILNPFVFYNIGVRLDSNAASEYDELTNQLNNILKSGGGYDALMKSNSKLKLKMLSVINERKRLINNYYEKFNIVKELIVNNRDKKIIVFNQFNEQTSKLYWYLLDFEVGCRVVHSGIKQSRREQDLIDFKNNKFNVLLTSKALDEGYNLPKLDMAVIMAGDSTDKQTMQRMGRVLRKKKDSNSLLCQLYCIGTVEEKAFKKRAKIFKSLSHDYRDLYFTPGQPLDLE